MVCRLNETAIKNPKMREFIVSMKAVINTPFLLAPAPPLHEVRNKLLFEFPYAVQVIDFVLAEFVGRLLFSSSVTAHAAPSRSR